jgi:hypothetical protein
VVVPFFRSGGFIDYQHRARVTQVVDDIAAQVIDHPVGVPTGPLQQVLHPIGGRVTGVLGDGPAIHPRQPREQPKDEPPGMPAALHPGEPATNPPHRFGETRTPPVRVYAVPRGHRNIILSPHNPRSSSGGRLTSGTATPKDHDLRLEY